MVYLKPGGLASDANSPLININKREIMKKLILLSTILFTHSVYADFDFERCSGSETFKQYIETYGGNEEKAVTVGTIPVGIQGLRVELISDKDLDIRLYGNDSDKIVHWPKGILNKSYRETKSYKNVPVTYSGYSGQNNKQGHELITVNDATPTAMTIKVFGYEAGEAVVNYSWTGKTDCNVSKDDNATFCTQEYAPVCAITNPCKGEICPAVLPIYKTFGNTCEMNVAKAEFAYQGVCNDSNDTTCTEEYAPVCAITVEGMSKTFGNPCMMDVAKAEFAYEGECNASYEKNITIQPKKVNCTAGFLINTNSKCLEIQEEGTDTWKDVLSIDNFTYEEGYRYKILAKVSKSDPNLVGAAPKSYELIKVLKKDFVDNNKSCTKEYAPVCAITEEGMFKTFGNTCMMDVAKAKFAYEGECNASYEKNITIQPKKVNCTGFMAPGSKCLQIQEEGTDTWEDVFGIKNFTYEEGYKYQILAKVSKSDPNLMDAPAKFYELIKILKKDLVDNNITGCTKEYAPVCAITNPCKGEICPAVLPIYKTFGNTCMMDVAKAEFAYEGKCKNTQK